jgi:hypothetical protein
MTNSVSFSALLVRDKKDPFIRWDPISLLSVLANSTVSCSDKRHHTEHMPNGSWNFCACTSSTSLSTDLSPFFFFLLKTQKMKAKLFLAIIAIVLATANAGCDFLSNAPVVETTIPTFQHTLKFLNVDATVYRHTLKEGESPRLRILRYSSNPIVDVDDDAKEIRISAEGDKCSPTPTSGSLSKKPSSALFFSTLMLAAVPTRFSGFRFVAALSMGMLALKTDAAEAGECTPSMQIVLEAPPYYLGSVEECLQESENPDHCPGESDRRNAK